MKKNTFYHHEVHYYIIISHNTSVPIIGHLELAIGMLTSHASRAWLIKNLSAKSDFSQNLLSRSVLDCELI